MNKRKITFEGSQHFPLQQLNKFIHFQSNNPSKPYKKEQKPSSKTASKSLYYHSTFTNKTTGIIAVQKRYINKKLSQHANAQSTLNEQILGNVRKASTAQYGTSRIIGNFNRIINPDLNNIKDQKISLRASSNHVKLDKIAGLKMNQKLGNQRKENYLTTKQNIRINKKKELSKQNQRIAKRLDSQHSQYSTKKLLRQSQSQQKISKRLSSSKLSHRSISRTLSSQNSSRSSLHSQKSIRSSINSLKSTSRSKGFNQISQFRTKQKQMKIIQHRIQKIQDKELNGFRNLFAGSFKQPPKVIATNSYNNSIKKLYNQEPITTYSNKKVKDITYYLPKTQKIQKNVNINFSTCDGMLHRIAEEMYTEPNNDILENKKKKHRKQSDSSIYKSKNTPFTMKAIQPNEKSKRKMQIHILNQKAFPVNKLSIKH